MSPCGEDLISCVVLSSYWKTLVHTTPPFGVSAPQVLEGSCLIASLPLGAFDKISHARIERSQTNPNGEHSTWLGLASLYFFLHC